MTMSRPPSMLPRALVGDTHALTGCSSIEPDTISTSGFSSKVVRQACTTFGLISTRTTLTSICASRRRAVSAVFGRCLEAEEPSDCEFSRRDFDQVLQPLLFVAVDHVFIVGELRRRFGR